MKRVLALFLACSLMFGILAACGGQDDSAEKVHWKVNSSVNEANCRYLVEVLDKIVEESDGQFTYELYPSSSLVQIGEVPAALYNNVCQIALVPCSVLSSQFAYNCEVVSMPFLGIEDNFQCYELYMDMFEEFPELEEELTKLGIKFWSCFLNSSYNFIWNSDRNPRLPEDFAGLKVQTTNVVMSSMLASLGAAPVSASATDLYSNLEKAVVDGAHQNYATAHGFGVAQVAKSTTRFPQGTHYDLNLYCMSLAAWNDLPDNIKALFEKYAGEASLNECKRQADTVETFFSSVGEDFKVYELTEEETEAWKQAVQPHLEETITSLEEKGYTRIREMHEYAVKWAEEN